MRDVGDELGYEDVDPSVAADFGLENRDDLDAINAHFQDLIRKTNNDHAAGRISRGTFEKWLKLKDDWLLYYQKVTSSWYVSDEDLAFARKKRDDANMLLMPKETEHVARTSKEKKPALTPEEFRKMQEEGMPWWERHWKMVAAATAVAVATVWLVAPRLLAAGVKAVGR